MNKNKFLLGTSFLLIGVLSILKYFGIVSLSPEQVLGTAIIFYSVPSVYYSLENGRREKLVWATVLFCVAVIFAVKSYFEILDTRGIVFVLILFAAGASFLLLFIENMKAKIFLLTSLSLILLSYLSVSLLKGLGLFDIVNKMGDLFETVWPAILILLGMTIFMRRKR